MRFIDRRNLRVPPILSSERCDQARREVEDFIGQTLERGATRRTPQSDWLDRNSEFRIDLEMLFGGKCAYCERSTSLELDSKKHQGLVGRHRPRMLAQDHKGNTDLLAYAWLMYDWENLLWLCPTCARNKGNRFYVGGDRGQPTMAIMSLRETERELFLDPCFHDPKEHLVFSAFGRVTSDTDIGRATIDVLNLNSQDLVTARYNAIQQFERVLRQGDVRSDGSVVRARNGGLLPHSGAVTIAVARLAWSGDARSRSADDLAEFLNSMDAKEKGDFADRIQVQATRGHSTASAEPPTAPRTKAKPYQPSRIPNIDQLPLALKPITRVEITNFKALREITFDLPEQATHPNQSACMLLLGENATGKSSVLEGIALALIGSREAGALDDTSDNEALSPIDLIHRPDPYRWSETAADLSVRLYFLGGEKHVELTAMAGDTRFSGTDHCAHLVLGYGPRRYFTSRKTRRLRAPAHRVRSLFDPMELIANPQLWLTGLDDKNFYAAARALREVLLLDAVDDFERDGMPGSLGQIYIRHNGQRVAMKDLSVGYKSVIAMVCDIIRELLYHFDNIEFASAVVLIDEVETHLHPRWKMRIMTVLRRAFPMVQFIVTTHDPLCLQGMYDGEVFVLHRSPADQIERVADLPSIRGMRAEQILTSEYFGLGSTDPETDARLARYNRLAARIEDLTDSEREELLRLRSALDDGMVLGSTLREQAYAEELKARVNQRVVMPTKEPSPSRADLRRTFGALFEKGPS